MANWGGAVICPYYISQGKKSVTCESVEEKEIKSTVMRFEREEKKKDWMEKYCVKWTYKECPYAKMKEERYGKEKI